MTKPITPEEVATHKLVVIPDVVFEVVNDLIAEKFINESAIVYQSQIVDRLTERGLNVNEIYDKGWLNFEEAYRKAGWKVQYDKPAYNESYRAYFEFSK